MHAISTVPKKLCQARNVHVTKYQCLVRIRKPKKILVFHFFIAFSQTYYLQSLIYCFNDKLCAKVLFRKHYFCPPNTFMRKGKDPDPKPGSGSVPLTNETDPGGPKNTCGSGSPTLQNTVEYIRGNNKRSK